MDYAIETRDLSKTYNGRIHALKGINLRVRAGSCLGLGYGIFSRRDY